MKKHAAIFHAKVSAPWLKGMCTPQYDGGSILNLMASIIRSRGGRSPHQELHTLPAASLTAYPRVVYLIVDGMGEIQLRRYLEWGGGRHFLGVHSRHVITSMFPATTAAAVTTFATGASPSEHGIVGWHLNLPDLGMVTSILPAVTRTKVPLAPKAFDLKRYLNLPTYMDSFACRRALLSWGHIPTSRYSFATPHWKSRLSYSTLRGMERRVIDFARSRGPGLAYAYWPEYDTWCHECGCSHRKTMRHLDLIDQSLGRITGALAKADTALIVTADHGLIDAAPDHRIELRDVPGFLDCLATLPSGDARQVECFVRPARVPEFLHVIGKHLARSCLVVPGREILASGLLGPGKPHPALPGRVGDFVLLARDDYGFGTSLPGAKSEFNEANHGGLSAAEMLVPLFAVTPRA